MKNLLTIILAGGVGQRLHPLTLHRAKPAVPFGGMYRIIDFTLSNCINSNCRQIQMLVQYKSNSLSRHIQAAWNIFRHELDEFIDIVPPQMRVNDNWYLGTADAVYQNLFNIEKLSPKHVMILSGDHIYKMDYQKMMAHHLETNAELTIASIEVDAADAHRYGILECAPNGRIRSFQEKPARTETVGSACDKAIASMGIYIFNTDLLRRCILEDAEDPGSSHDFGKDIIPRLINSHRLFAYPFEDENKKAAKYWRDVGTLDAYFEANMDLVSVDPLFNLYDKDWPLRTNLPMLPPAKFVFADYGHRFGAAVDSIVSPGCIVSGAMLQRCVLSPEVHVGSYSTVQDSILMNGASIGRHARIRRAIIEKCVVIPDHAVIGYDMETDAKRYFVSPTGITVVCPDDLHDTSESMSDLYEAPALV